MKKTRSLILIFFLLPFLAFSQQILFDNGPFINGPGQGTNGVDISFLQSTSLGMATVNFDAQRLLGRRLADQFTVPEGEIWDLSEIILFANEEVEADGGSSVASLRASMPIRLNSANLRIWDGTPGVTSDIVFGDLTTNLATAIQAEGSFRTIEGSLFFEVLPIIKVTTGVNTSLPAGTYWIDYQFDAVPSNATGPFVHPITINGQTSTGDALRSEDNGSNWIAALDQGTNTPQGLPFQVLGTKRTIVDPPVDPPAELPALGSFGKGLLAFMVLSCALGAISLLRRELC